MLDKVKNIVKLNFTDVANGAVNASRKVPEVNSIARLEVIGKEGAAYKILVNGKLFVSKLPVKAVKGDLFLAKVLRTNPFELQLNSIVSTEINENLITQLLVSLNIKESNAANKLLKALLKSGKIIKRSKLKKLIDLVDENDFDPTENNLLLFTQLFWNDANLNDLNSKAISYFKYSVNDISQNIYDLLFGTDNKIDEPALSTLKQIFVFELTIDEDKSRLNNYPNERTNALVDWVNVNRLSANRYVQKLVTLISTYLFQKKFYKRISLQPDFIIVKVKNDYKLVNLSVKPGVIDSDDDTLRFICDFTTEKLGKMEWKGTLLHNQLNLLFNGSANSFRALSENEEEFINSVKINHRLSTKIFFTESPAAILNFGEEFLNATA